MSIEYTRPYAQIGSKFQRNFKLVDLKSDLIYVLDNNYWTSNNFYVVPI